MIPPDSDPIYAKVREVFDFDSFETSKFLLQA